MSLYPDSCYLFTQVALETLRWAHKADIPTVLDNPNGHIRNFHQICEEESVRWFDSRFRGHPNSAMIERVEEEYHLADHIRVYSKWGKQSMVEYGLPECKLQVIRQTVNLHRFCPPVQRSTPHGPLRVCYVGSLDLRKGFAYLLRAIRAVGPNRIYLTIVGATGDRECARLLRRESTNLQMECAPGDPLPAYQAAELLVVPTLEDGLPFVLLEGMACGLPVIVTDQAGGAECVRVGESGWVVPARQVEPLAAALEDALHHRLELMQMGRIARSGVEHYAGPPQIEELRQWYYKETAPAVIA